MAKIKGWNKFNDYTWINKNDSVKIITRYNKNQKIVGYTIEIFVFETQKTLSSLKEKNFKTKDKAIEYAYKYMKSHSVR